MRATSRTQHPQHTKNEVTKPCAFQELNLQRPQHRACSSLGWEPPARSGRGLALSTGWDWGSQPLIQARRWSRGSWALARMLLFLFLAWQVAREVWLFSL